jgi:hypothetical protein
MRTRTTLAAVAMLAVGALCGWLAASGRLAPSAYAQEKQGQAKAFWSWTACMVGSHERTQMASGQRSHKVTRQSRSSSPWKGRR